MSCIYKVTKKDLEKARKNIGRSKRGSDKEYFEHIMNIHKEMKPLRDRADKTMLEIKG